LRSVEAHFLGTRGEVGYVVRDITAIYTADMLHQPWTLLETIQPCVLF